MSAPPPDSLNALSNAVQGSFHRFLDIYEPLRPELYRYCRYLTASPWDAEDLAQDTFVRAFVHFERFDPERPVLPWLIAIARRLCLDLLRRRKVMARVETLPVTGPSARGPEGEASLREQLSRLERALDELDEGPRMAIVLFHIEEMSYRDIAAALEVPIGTVMTWLHRGRAQLKRTLDSPSVT